MKHHLSVNTDCIRTWVPWIFSKLAHEYNAEIEIHTVPLAPNKHAQVAPKQSMLHGQRFIRCSQCINFIYMVLAAYMYTKAKQDLHLQGEIRIYISKLLFTNVSTTAYARSVMLNSVKRHQAWTYVWKVNQEMIYVLRVRQDTMYKIKHVNRLSMYNRV